MFQSFLRARQARRLDSLCNSIVANIRQKIAGKIVIGVVGKPAIDQAERSTQVFCSLAAIPRVVLLTDVIDPAWTCAGNTKEAWQSIDEVLSGLGHLVEVRLDKEVHHGIVKAALLDTAQAWVFGRIASLYDYAIFSGILARGESLTIRTEPVPVLSLSEETDKKLDAYPYREFSLNYAKLFDSSRSEEYIATIRRFSGEE
jgi:hypothetical protein